ncbi:MAG: DUF4388 domain-containing protein [Vicinamibacteria bacterium]
MAIESKLEQASTSFDWVGPLSATPLAEVMRKIALEERSGDLQVIFGQTIKTIYFDRGFAVLAASNVKSDRLGESLIERGRISRHELALATMLMKTGQKKIGQTLVQAGMMSEEELSRSVALQVNRIALSLFKVTDGIYSFDERPTNIPMKLMVSLSIYRILLEGIRRMTKGNLILQGLPPLDTVLRVSEQPPFTIDFGQLKPVEQSLLRAGGRGATIRSITERLEQDRGRILRACYGLLYAGLLEEDESDRTPRPLKVQEETGVFLLSDLEKKFAKIQATNARQEILIEFDHLGEMAEADLLKVDKQTDMENIRQAYESRSKEWSIKRNLVEQERSLVVKVDEIQARLERAYQQMLSDHSAPLPPLSNQAAAEWSSPHIDFAESDALDQTEEGETVESSPAQRARAQEAIEKVQELEDARQAQQIQEAQRTNEEDELEIEIEVETGEFDTPALPPLIEDEPEEASFIKNEVEPQLGPQIELEVEEAAAPAEIEIDDEASHAQLKIEEDAAAPQIEVEVEVEVEVEDAAPQIEIEVEEEVAPTKIEVQEEAAPAAAAEIEIEVDEDASEPADTKPNVRHAGISSREVADGSEAPRFVQKELLPEQRDERVRQLFRDVKLHFTVRDWDGAVSLLMELVELEPNNAHHHGMLAKAMLRHPVMRKNAERHFIEALRLAPQDADLHFWLGLYYKTFGLKSRAETEFRTALRIDPKHQGARKYLTGGGKRKDPLRNLFG